jgi:lactose/L-arabinose transport system ATP-binding protein
MGFALKLAGLDQAEIDRKVEEAATTLDLTKHLDRRPVNLSGGQRQRVAMGRAIVRDPKAFLMDEPLSNLDAKLRVQMRTEVARLQSDLKTTMVYVTHDQTEAMTLGDRVAVMRAGVLQQVGSPDDLYSRPRNLFVAGFIGSPRMNFLDGTLDPNGVVRLDCGAVFKTGLLHGEGDIPIKAGIRPEHFTGHDDAGGAIDLKVDVVENLGGTRFIYGTLSSGQAVIIEDRSETIRRPGESVTAGFPARRALLFGGDGERIRGARPANTLPAG